MLHCVAGQPAPAPAWALLTPAGHSLLLKVSRTLKNDHTEPVFLDGLWGGIDSWN
jgi:hypothetical protein